MSSLPPGFELDEPEAPSVVSTAPPAGFVIDADQEELKSEQSAQNLVNMPMTTLGDYGKAAVGMVEGGINLVGRVGSAIGAGVAGTVDALRPNNFIMPDPEAKGNTMRVEGDPNNPYQRTDRAVNTIDTMMGEAGEAFQPITEGGEIVQEAAGAGMESVGKGIKYPLSAVPFVTAEMREGGNTGTQEREKFMEMPIGDYLGELAQDSGASPLWATLAHMVPTAVELALTKKVGESIVKGAKPAPPKPKAPTIDALKAEADAFYKLLDDSGITIADDVVIAQVDQMIAAAAKKGARKELTPNIVSALEILKKDAAAGGLSLAKAEELRRVLKSGYGTSTADNALITGAIASWDRFITNLSTQKLTSQSGAVIPADATQWAKSARGLWSRKRKTEVIEELIKKAEIDWKSGTMTSGISHHVRVQFRQLAKNEKKMKLFTANEQAVIRLAASGEPLERAMRLLGKMAPTNQISIMGDVAVAAGVGATAGGPIGGAVGIAMPIVGLLARRLSNTRLTRYADEASATMRRGPTEPVSNKAP